MNFPLLLIAHFIFISTFSRSLSSMPNGEMDKNSTIIWRENQEEKFSQRKTNNSAKICGGENMAYSLELPFGGKNCCQILWGKGFDCKLQIILRELGLEDPKNEENEERGEKAEMPAPIILTAANDAFFPFLRTYIYGVKRAFGREQKIIGYDLGGISENEKMMGELGRVCNLEWRKFNFSMLPPDVHNLKTFSWKILIIAQVLLRHSPLIYADTSVHFHSTGFGPFLEAIQKGRISPWQQLTDAGHGIPFATHPGTYSYIPHIWEEIDGPGQKWEKMPQAGLAIVHKSKNTRKMLKWAVLCACTRECIDPRGSTLKCPFPYKGRAKCHRQDQSVLAILLNNLEEEMSRKNPNLIGHFDARNPRFLLNSFFKIERRKPLPANVDFVNATQCPNLF